MKQYDWLKFALFGAAAGAVNGMFGAGGGMVLVPLLIGPGKIEDKKAFASAICIILPLCIISILVYSTKGILPFSEAIPYLIGGLIGGTLGGIFFKRVSPGMLHKLFGILILWGGIKLLR